MCARICVSENTPGPRQGVPRDDRPARTPSFLCTPLAMIEAESRSAEIIKHHVQCCGSIVGIPNDGQRTSEQIVVAHFEPNLLKGFGFRLAENEVRSHLELLEHSGDAEWGAEDRVERSGTTRVEQ